MISPWNNSDLNYQGETEQSSSKEKFIIITPQDEKINFIKPNLYSQFWYHKIYNKNTEILKGKEVIENNVLKCTIKKKKKKIMKIY